MLSSGQFISICSLNEVYFVPTRLLRYNRRSGLKCWHLHYRCQGITQKKACYIITLLGKNIMQNWRQYLVFKDCLVWLMSWVCKYTNHGDLCTVQPLQEQLALLRWSVNTKFWPVRDHLGIKFQTYIACNADSHNSVISIVTRLWDGKSGVQILAAGRFFPSSPKCPD
jgi:hypothetical protein